MEVSTMGQKARKKAWILRSAGMGWMIPAAPKPKSEPPNRQVKGPILRPLTGSEPVCPHCYYVERQMGAESVRTHSQVGEDGQGLGRICQSNLAIRAAPKDPDNNGRRSRR